MTVTGAEVASESASQPLGDELLTVHTVVTPLWGCPR